MPQASFTPRSVRPGTGFGATSKFMAQYGPEQQMLKVARVAIWNLQWQVSGFVAAKPTIDPKILTGRFVDGSDVEGIDLRASVVDTPWEVLDYQTCRLLLTITVALYENWCHELCKSFQLSGIIVSANKRKYEDGLQWPDPYPGHSGMNISSVITNLTSNDGVSPGMTHIANRVQSTQVNVSTFSPRMTVYRMFKEARNAIAHQGGVATKRLCTAYNECTSIVPADLGMRIVPSLDTPALGRHVQLSWRSIIGFADMLRRMVVDVDHLLMSTQTAMQDLSLRLRGDPLALVDPALADTLIKQRAWAK